jgi:predicted nucleic acid-binding Zn ribbon protein
MSNILERIALVRFLIVKITGGTMPVYVYRNLKTGETFDLEQRITESALSSHPQTGEPVKRLIQPVGISFKGSGFYVTDSRNSGGSSKPKADANKADVANADSTKADSSKTDTPKTDASKAETKSETKSEAKPKSESKPATKSASPSSD